MKLAKEIAEALDERFLKFAEMTGEQIIAAHLEPVRETLEKIAHYNHSDDCDGWHDDAIGRINPDTGSVYRFNSCPVYECDCSRNAGGMNQWELADRALTLLFYD